MFEFFQLQARTARMLIEAQTVISMRMLGMAGVVESDDGETLRMMTEKQDAFSKAAMAATGALMAGKTPMQAYGLALTPIGRTTRHNSARLTKRH